MARPLRLQFPGALYHVISRGDNRRAIVKDDTDRQRRLDWLARTVQRHEWRLHAFVLMTNHEHLFVETPQPNLAEGMKLLNAAYTQYFNSRYKRCGHLFQGRYKSQLVENEGHYDEISRYIHLNPVRAGMVEDPANYSWSSYPGYIHLKRRLDWIDYRRVLYPFAPGRTHKNQKYLTDVNCRRRYAAYVRAGIKDKPPCPWSEAREGFLIGSESFLETIKAMLPLSEAPRHVPLHKRLSDRPSLEQIIQLVSEDCEEDPSNWKTGRRSNGGGRALSCYLSRRIYRYDSAELQAQLGYRHPGSIGVMCTLIERNRRMMKQAERLHKMLDRNA